MGKAVGVGRRKGLEVRQVQGAGVWPDQPRFMLWGGAESGRWQGFIGHPRAGQGQTKGVVCEESRSGFISLDPIKQMPDRLNYMKGMGAGYAGQVRRPTDP